MKGVIELKGGRISGVERNGVWSFSGIPYAASPAGDRRWRPPVAPDPWIGIRECGNFPPSAPQARMAVGMPSGTERETQSEDCLYLNVWTPAIDHARRPVMVWIHGGGFTSGSGAGNLSRGGVMARESDVVVVTFNYRLGALGFLAHPSLADAGQPWLGGDAWSGFGNWGLADQMAALVWVKEHIDSFGGDPGLVTIFGESAGGMSVSALLGVPAAKGLFHRAIIESGPPYTHPAEKAIDRANGLASLLGVPMTRDALGKLPADQLVRAVDEMGRTVQIGDGLPLPLLPTVDGGLLAHMPEESVGAGAASDIPLMIGTNRDEAAFFALGIPQIATLDDRGLERWVSRVTATRDDAVDVIAAYRDIRAARVEPVGSPDLWVAIASDTIFRLPSIRLAGAHSSVALSGIGTFVYLFTWETPVLGGALGSCHGLEIPFVFGTVKNPNVQLFSGGGDRALGLSEAMRRSWSAFARTGTPSNATAGEWPAWDSEARVTMAFGPWPQDDGMWRPVPSPRDGELTALGRALGPVTVGDP
ncbi:MAG: carboxylesterase/lipase family protein [Acidimicrobiales bacterium]